MITPRPMTNFLANMAYNIHIRNIQQLMTGIFKHTKGASPLL